MQISPVHQTSQCPLPTPPQLEAYLGVVERHPIAFFLVATLVIAFTLALTAYKWRGPKGPKGP
jgi:hypothetical protein